jgi:T4 RnlA family RNA ligase
MLSLDKLIDFINETPSFYFKEEIVNGQKIKIFNYRLASYNDFIKNPNIALELRGLAINEETGEYFLGLHKFFNNNENPFSNNELFEWKKEHEYEVVEKLDGSLILPTIINNELVLRTKGTFFSEQAQMANEFIEKNNNYKKFILEMINNGFIPFFEFISPFNQIVVDYPKTELKLIQIRKIDNGEYLNYNDLKKEADKFKIEVVQKYNYSIDEIKEMQKNIEGIEGWIVRNLNAPFEYSFRKFKTDWYFELHRIISPDVLKENDIIKHVLNETIDDILSQVKGEKYNKIVEIVEKLDKFINNVIRELENLFEELQNTNRKEFAIKYKNHPYFPVLMTSKSKDDLYDNLKNLILKRTNKLEKAKDFLKNIL